MEAPADNRHCGSGSDTAVEGIAPAAAPLRVIASAVSKVLPVPAITAFAHGFVGTAIGGMVYLFAPPWLQLREVPFGAASILGLATILGAFEVWRVSAVRAPDLVRSRILLLAVMCLILLLTIAGLAPAITPPPPQEWPWQQGPPMPLAPQRTMFC